VSPEPSREPSGEPAREPEPIGEPAPEPPGEPGSTGTDDIDQQITTLASRLRNGDQLTKTTAAALLGVSPATAGRRLKDARTRVGKGTGFYP
jgi:DNA-directed RNA polymerase specialized sigma24 family protein